MGGGGGRDVGDTSLAAPDAEEAGQRPSTRGGSRTVQTSDRSDRSRHRSYTSFYRVYIICISSHGADLQDVNDLYRFLQSSDLPGTGYGHVIVRVPGFASTSMYTNSAVRSV